MRSAWPTTRPGSRLRVQSGIKLQEDSIASIKTKGLIGEKYIRISPGARTRSSGRTARSARSKRRSISRSCCRSISSARYRPGGPPMTWLARALVLAVLLPVVLADPQRAWAGAPTDQLRAEIDRAVEDPGRPGAQERRPAARSPRGGSPGRQRYLRLSETAKRSLARHWTPRTQAERTSSSSFFTDLLERSVSREDRALRRRKDPVRRREYRGRRRGRAHQAGHQAGHRDPDRLPHAQAGRQVARLMTSSSRA